MSGLAAGAIHWVRRHDAELAVFDSGGSGTPVLLVHSFPQDSRVWNDLGALLAPRYRVLAVDMRGFGRSSKPLRGYDTRTRAGDIVAVFDDLGIDRAAVIAHGWGAWAAFVACERHPDRFSRLIALNVIHPWTNHRRVVPNLWRQYYTLLFEVPYLGRFVIRRIPAVVDAYVTRTGRAPMDVHVAVYEDDSDARAAARAAEQLHFQFVARDIPKLMTNRLRRMPLQVPTLLIGGSHDPVYPPAMLHVPDPLREFLHVAFVQGAGHWLHAEQPAAVHRLAADFIERAYPYRPGGSRR